MPPYWPSARIRSKPRQSQRPRESPPFSGSQAPTASHPGGRRPAREPSPRVSLKKPASALQSQTLRRAKPPDGVDPRRRREWQGGERGNHDIGRHIVKRHEDNHTTNTSRRPLGMANGNTPTLMACSHHVMMKRYVKHEEHECRQQHQQRHEDGAWREMRIECANRG